MYIFPTPELYSIASTCSPEETFSAGVPAPALASPLPLQFWCLSLFIQVWSPFNLHFLGTLEPDLAEESPFQSAYLEYNRSAIIEIYSHSFKYRTWKAQQVRLSVIHRYLYLVSYSLFIFHMDHLNIDHMAALSNDYPQVPYGLCQQVANSNETFLNPYPRTPYPTIADFENHTYVNWEDSTHIGKHGANAGRGTSSYDSPVPDVDMTQPNQHISSTELQRVWGALMNQIDWLKLAKEVATNTAPSFYYRTVEKILLAEIHKCIRIERQRTGNLVTSNNSYEITGKRKRNIKYKDEYNDETTDIEPEKNEHEYEDSIGDKNKDKDSDRKEDKDGTSDCNKDFQSYKSSSDDASSEE